jgi:NADP-dependent aldehyde dehydrogenase
MELHGRNIIGGRESFSEGDQTFRAFAPAEGQELEPAFHEATEAQVDSALELADRAFHEYRRRTPEETALFLERAADEIMALGDALIERANAETALGPDRLSGERVRTVNQLRMFAALVREGSWVEATIDRAIPDRRPIPKPDLRRMLIPLGPVVVFGASNFPLAFSVAGGDTASALAARCPVVVKAHPAHPGTSEMVARAILKAVEATGMPDGVFSLLHGASHAVGLGLVRHPLTRAVGFTGSLKGGRALFDAAAARPDPIPVYAEMGSINPVFVLPGALRERGEAFAEGLKQSVTLGVGQFCTNPGLVVGLQDESLDRFIGKMAELIAATPPGTMLYPGIRRAFEAGVAAFSALPGVKAHRAQAAPDPARNEVGAVLFSTDAATFLNNHQLSEEVFGPSTLVVRCESTTQLEDVARNLQGHLTATIHGTGEDLDQHRNLVAILENKVGRLIFNSFPTGVEVCPAMHHGGPYPATTDVHFTSVGTAAIKRFARPICYQNFPPEALPVELQNTNKRGIWRLVDNQLTRADL